MTIPLEELEARLARVQAGLIAEQVEAAMIVQTADLYYLTGTAQQSHLLLPAQGEPLLLVRRDPARARQESPLPRLESLVSLRDLPAALARLGLPAPSRLALELDVMPVTVFRRYQQLFPETEFADCSPILREARAVKTPYEIALLEQAGRMSQNALDEAAAAMKPGVTEAAIAGVIMASFMRQGHPGLLRMRGLNQEMPCVHVLSGPDAGVASYTDAPFGGRGHTPAVPQGAGPRSLAAGEAVAIDLGAMVEGYIVDQTRTFCLGSLPDDLRQAYEACRLIYQELCAATRPGVPAGDLYDLALTRAQEMGYGETFLGAAPMQVSFIGHGIGLEVDELPVLGRGSARRLQAGNVLAIEPKILLPGRGAVGIEDTFLVREGGLKQLTPGDDQLRSV